MTTQHMPLRRKDRHASTADARRIMESCDFAVLCTTDNDNMPYGVPVSAVLEEDHVYFHCALAGRKLENIRHNSHVCLTFANVLRMDGENFTTHYESVIAEGTATVVETDTEKTHALQLISRRYTNHNDTEIDAYIQRYFSQTSIVCVKLENVSAKANF